MTRPHHADDVGGLLRDLAPRVLGALARRHGDFADAEDAVQEALIAAAGQWPREGIPANPSGWLYHVATRRMADRIRSESARRAREDAAAAPGGPWAEWAFVPAPDADPDLNDDDALPLESNLQWLNAPIQVGFGVLLDPLSIVMANVVAVISKDSGEMVALAASLTSLAAA